MKECWLGNFFPPEKRLKQSKTKTSFPCVRKGKTEAYMRVKSRLLEQRGLKMRCLKEEGGYCILASPSSGERGSGGPQFGLHEDSWGSRCPPSCGSIIPRIIISASWTMWVTDTSVFQLVGGGQVHWEISWSSKFSLLFWSVKNSRNKLHRGNKLPCPSSKFRP